MIQSINYSRAEGQAREINSLASELEHVSKELNSLINELPSIWSSDNAKTFYNKCIELKENIDSTSKNMKNLSSKVSTAISDIRDHDRVLNENANKNKKTK